jgi:hypothetical protein
MTMVRKSEKVRRYDATDALENELKKVERVLYRLTDKARDVGVPHSGIMQVVEAWSAVLHATQAVSRVSLDVLCDYNDAAIERRLNILTDGFKRERSVAEVWADIEEIPRDYTEE